MDNYSDEVGIDDMIPSYKIIHNHRHK